ncbi:unnamed protein product [Malus baccata var. baccata]
MRKSYVASIISEVVDQAPPASSSSSHDESAKDNKTATTYLASGSKSETSPGIFDHIISWCKFGRSSPCSDKLSDQSCDAEPDERSLSSAQALFNRFLLG